MKFQLAILAVILGVFHGYGQQSRDRFPSYFGVIMAPVIPTDFLGSKSSTFQDDSQTLTATFDQKTGFMFGASVRIGLTRTFSLETGISQIRRSYNVTHNIPDSNVFASKKFNFISYDIPLNGLAYVQMTDKIFMDASLGISVSHYPSDISDTIRIGKYQLVQEGRRTARTYFALNAGIGFEYRTEKSGTFYLGASGKVPLKQILVGVAVMNDVLSTKKIAAYGPVDGNFLSIDLRYYLPNIRSKGSPFKGGPIE